MGNKMILPFELGRSGSGRAVTKASEIDDVSGVSQQDVNDVVKGGIVNVTELYGLSSCTLGEVLEAIEEDPKFGTTTEGVIITFYSENGWKTVQYLGGGFYQLNNWKEIDQSEKLEAIEEADNALFSDNFKDPNVGWQKYMDMDSFVDWYLIHEISKNEDSMFHFSTYMNLQRGGKLKMGPIWDFDIAFGNVKEKETTAMLPEGLMLSWSTWYTRLMQDPAFVSKLRERYKYFYRHKEDFISYINSDAQYLRYAAQENQKRWGTFYHYSYKQYDIWGSYQNEAQSLKEWLNERMEWLKKSFKI